MLLSYFKAPLKSEIQVRFAGYGMESHSAQVRLLSVGIPPIVYGHAAAPVQGHLFEAN